MVVPIDVVKTRLQMDASLRGPVDAIKSVIAGGHGKGAARLLPFFNGVGATAVGYLAQGAFKFGGYEFFKRSTFAALREQGETGEAIAHHMRLPIMIGSAAAAEVWRPRRRSPLSLSLPPSLFLSHSPSPSLSLSLSLPLSLSLSLPLSTLSPSLLARSQLSARATAMSRSQVVASAALCPLEVLKLKMQTSPQLAALGLRGAMVHVSAQRRGPNPEFPPRTNRTVSTHLSHEHRLEFASEYVRSLTAE